MGVYTLTPERPSSGVAPIDFVSLADRAGDGGLVKPIAMGEESNGREVRPTLGTELAVGELHVRHSNAAISSRSSAMSWAATSGVVSLPVRISRTGQSPLS